MTIRSTVTGRSRSLRPGGTCSTPTVRRSSFWRTPAGMVPTCRSRTSGTPTSTDRAGKHFSAVIFTAPHFRGLEANADGRTAFTGRERIAIDPLFFQRLDRAVDAMNDRGLLAVPLILHAGKDTERNSGYFLPEDQAVAADALHHRPLRRPSRPLGSRGGGRVPRRRNALLEGRRATRFSPMASATR